MNKDQITGAEQAIGFLDACVSKAELSRADHVQAQQAIMFIKGFVDEAAAVPDPVGESEEVPE